MGVTRQPTAIVLAAGPNGLGVVRSLHLRGIRSTIVTRTRKDIVNSSWIPREKHIIAGNCEEEERAWLLSFLKSMPEGTAVIPTSDWFVSFLSENEAALRSNCDFVIPAPEMAALLIDKAAETATIGKVVPIPDTVQQLESAEGLRQKLTVPVIVKPRSHKHKGLGRKNLVLRTDDEIDLFFREFGDIKDQFIVQEVIAGEDIEQWVCNCVFDLNSQLAQAFTFNRLGLSPAHFGVTSYAISESNPEICSLAAVIGQALGYVGPAMIEFKRDPRDGQFKYIELNPRLGMCNYFDTACGVNNAYATFCLARSIPLNPVADVADGVVFISLHDDLYSRVKDGQGIRAIAKLYASHAFANHVFIYFVWWDPAPAIIQGSRQAASFLASVFRKIVRRGSHGKHENCGKHT